MIYFNLEKFADTSINNTLWYHGGKAGYDRLEFGNGVDGRGIYLTSNYRRAQMYASKDSRGQLRTDPYVYKVKVHVDADKVLSDRRKYNVRDFVDNDATWLAEYDEKYGKDWAIMDGASIQDYAFGKNTDKILASGFDALQKNDDLIVLNQNIIVNFL